MLGNSQFAEYDTRPVDQLPHYIAERLTGMHFNVTADARRKGWTRVAVVLVIAACIAALTGCSDNQAEKAAQEQAQKEAARKAAMKEAFNVGDPTQNKHKGFKGGWPPAGGKREEAQK
jgi:hypothetical protein